MMRHSMTADILVPDGKEVKISTVDAKPWVVPFKPFGKGFERQPETVEAIDYICKFNKDELFLLQQIYSLVEDDCKLFLRLGDYTPAEKAKLKRAIPLWIEKELLVRLKRERYMVNPWFLVPPKHEQLNAVNRWRLLNPQYPRRSSLHKLASKLSSANSVVR